MLDNHEWWDLPVGEPGEQGIEPMVIGLLSLAGRRSRMDPREMHEILRNSRRRRVIEELGDRIEPISLRELSERIAADETGEEPPPRNVRDSVYNSLHQTHLPKLDDMDVVEYDEDRKRIELRERAKQVSRTMRAVTTHGVSWAQFYRTVGVAALVSVVLAQADLPVFGGIPVLGIASLFLFVFAAATAYQMWTLRWFYARSLLSRE